MGKRELILCDSNIIIALMRGNDKVKSALKSIGSDNVALSIVTHAEIYAGASKENVSDMRRRLNQFHLLHLNEEISKIFNGICLYYMPSHSIKIPDAFIAATAIANNLRLYTNNRKDFDFIPEIRLYNPA
jgi:predicted nucleic acid-binding protein